MIIITENLLTRIDRGVDYHYKIIGYYSIASVDPKLRLPAKKNLSSVRVLALNGVCKGKITAIGWEDMDEVYDSLPKKIQSTKQ